MLLAHADGSPASAPFTPGALGSTDPFGHARRVAYLAADGIAAGVIQANGEFVIDDYPHIEMLVVHAGRVTLQDEQQALELSAGDSVVIGRGTALRVQAQAGSLWAFCADTQTVEERNSGLTLLDPLDLLAPSNAPDAEILLSRAPQCRSHNTFADSASDLRIGIWDSTPYTRRARPHKLHELMHLIEGSVTLQAADGSDLRVNTGDTVFVPQGAPCAWKSTVYVRKFYVVK
jgi:uncharacterized cupin superfamily protein